MEETPKKEVGKPEEPRPEWQKGTKKPNDDGRGVQPFYNQHIYNIVT